MFQSLIKILLNRNMILVLAVLSGILLGEHADRMKDYTLFILAFVMMFSMTGIDSRSLYPVRAVFRPMLEGIFLNYILFSLVIIPLAWFLMPDRELFYGFVVIAATPPGVAVIPFSQILGGNMRYSILGTFGAFLGSILLSRLLLLPRVFKVVEKIRGQVVNWGFAIIIYTAVGMNRQVFYGDIIILLLISSVLVVSLFGMGSLYEIFAGKRVVQSDVTTTRTLLLTIKSSGFAAVTAFSLFGDRAAIPSAIMAVFVLLYFIFLSFRKELKDRKKE